MTLTTSPTVRPPAAKAREFREKPSALVLQRAAAFAERGQNHPAQVRRAFIRTEDPFQPAPLATSFKGGRGGNVRLKLYLSILFVAKWPPHAVGYPAQSWAELLGLPDPRTKGARRITDAVAWLERHQLLAVERRAGHPTVLKLMNDSGNGQAYRRPFDTDEVYSQIPVAFWTRGWVEILSATAVTVLLVLTDQHGPPERPPHDIWLSTKMRDEAYGISEETMARGVEELHFHGIVSFSRRPQGEVFEFRRLRKIYRLNFQALERGPLVAP